jgi:hypothetical protein
VTVSGLDVPLAVRVVPPPAQLTVYPVMGEPPFADGGVNETVALVLPGTAVPMIGAPGTPRGVAVTVAEAGPAPNELVATTEQV